MNPTVTLVTGAGSGIGAALCRRLAGPGRAILVHAGHDGARAEAVASEARAKGAAAEAIVRDLGEDPAGAADLVAAAVQRFGRLDHAVHCAGRADRRPLGELDAAGFEAALALNARAFFHLATAALPLVAASPAGRVVAVGSFAAATFRLGPEMAFPATAASKAALAALVQSLAMRLAPSGATANCVVPGFIAKEAGRHTAMDEAARARVAGEVPMGRFGSADEVAAAIAFLLAPDAAYVTGQCIGVDGGLSL